MHIGSILDIPMAPIIRPKGYTYKRKDNAAPSFSSRSECKLLALAQGQPDQTEKASKNQRHYLDKNYMQCYSLKINHVLLHST
jgi:hypothetical protein